MRLKMAFVGTALGLFGYFLLATFSFYLFIIPGAWGMVALYSWMARNTQLSDGSTLEFTGTPGQFLKLLAITISLPLVFIIIMAAAIMSIQQNGQNPDQFAAFFMLLAFPMYPWAIYWGFRTFKWAVAGVRFGWGGQLEFTGSIWGYLGWMIVYLLSAILIIAPFWVLSAFFKWMCEKTTSSTGDRLHWVGSGWELLWRSFVAWLWMIPMVTIPWAMRWYFAWMVSQVEVERVGVAAPMGYAPPAAYPPPNPFPPPTPPATGGRYGGMPSGGGPANNDPGLWGPG